MRNRIRRGGVALVLVAAGWLGCLSSSTQAHPQLAGEWVSPTPPGGFLIFHFCQGQHLGNGLWRGTCSLNVSNSSLLEGTYELQMLDDHIATLTPLRNATNMLPTVGLVDFDTGVLTLKNVSYRRRAPVVAVPVVRP